MTDKATRLILSGRIKYEEEITAAQAAQIITFLNPEEGEAPAISGSRPAPDTVNPRAGGARAENARDAIVRSGAKTNPEKIVAFAAYVLQDGGETVKGDAIKAQFQRARETAPAKFARDLSTAISAGWMAEGVGGELYLTNKVEGIFEDGFSFPKAGSNGRQRPTRKATAKSAKPESLVEIDEFQAVMSGYPPYAKLKFEKDRLLWILVYLRDNHRRKTVTYKEIAWVSDHVGIGIPAANIAGAFRSAKDSGYATRSTTARDNSIKVTDAGAEYLSKLGESASA